MLELYISSFSKELDKINTSSLIVDNYPAQYLQYLLDNRLYFLHLYAQVLEKIIRKCGKQKEAISLLDYGSGNGLLGMFARHCGFKTVTGIDVNPAFVHAAQALNRQLSIPVDNLLTGDMPDAVHFFTSHALPDAVAATDVIEHIYHLPAFLSGLKSINSRIVVACTTASVTSNPFKSHRLKKLQRQDEYIASERAHTVPDNPYAGLSFLEARKRIIQSHYTLQAMALQQLALATRGMRQEDILQAAAHFIKTNQLPTPPAHPTNTCDPYTGNWTERLLTVKEYRHLFEEAGFGLQVYNGFYNRWQGGYKARLAALLNMLLTPAGAAGRWMAPYIVLVGS